MLRPMALLLGIIVLSGCSRTSIEDDRCLAEPMHGRAYVFRGMINFFSTGMNDLAARMRLCGVDATAMHHSAWRSVANELQQNPPQEPLVFVGHSLGADAAIDLANTLGEAQIPVDAIVTFDPFSPCEIDDNTARVMNLYQLDGWGNPLASQGYSGVITNTDVTTLPASDEVTHFNIDDNREVHRAVMRYLATEAGMAGLAPASER